ncbi:hypothetical protein V8D89_002546 [Ganoderma adspersum]
MASNLSSWICLSAWVLEAEPSTFALSSRWSNKDMGPVPTGKRTSPTINCRTSHIGSPMPGTPPAGNSPREVRYRTIVALPAIAVGSTIIAVVMVFNGTVGARLYVSFPVLNRSSFGFWFSYFGVVGRMVLSMFRLSIQAYAGSQCVYQMLKAICPSVAIMPHHLPLRANITTSGELMFMSPQRIRWPFMLEAFVVPPRVDCDACLDLHPSAIGHDPIGPAQCTLGSSSSHLSAQQRDGVENSFLSFTQPVPATGSFMSMCVAFAQTSRGSTPSDLATLTEAVKAAHRFAAAPAWQDFILAPFGASASTTTDDDIAVYVAEQAATFRHPVGTTRIETREEGPGVVDASLLVKGVRGLRVVDASIFSRIFGAHLQAPVYAVVERAADLIKRAHGIPL